MNHPAERAIHDLIQARGITEVLHFTTNNGVLGMLATGALKSRALLSEDEYVEHIFRPNARIRRDPEWVGHVSLSISQVNGSFFKFARDWHATESTWWCIVALDPAILAHADVTFCTTNNIYTGVRRGQGVGALQALFAPKVHQFAARYARRTPDMPDSWTTCNQAEILYPSEVSTRFLRRIYLREARHRHVHRAQIASLGHDPVEVIVDPDLFGA